MRTIALPILAVLATLTGAAHAAPLTADEAVRIALQKNSLVIQSEASVLDARSGLWSAYSRVLPNVSADVTRNGSFVEESRGTQLFGTTPLASSSFDSERYSGSYGLSGSWSVLNLSSLTGLSSSRQSMKAAQFTRRATRADVVLETKRRFYEVVKAVHLAGVSSQALHLSRDDERRVRALFEVGSVSKSDLLKAQVRTSTSQLDSLVADHTVTFQRIRLAEQLGVGEGNLGDVDTTLTAAHQSIDAGAVLAAARTARPDVRAAEASVKAAELGLRSAHWARLPNLSVTGGYTPQSVSTSKLFDSPQHDNEGSSNFKSLRGWNGSVSVNMDVFDGFATDAAVAAARARLIRSRETRDALLRNLGSQVRQATLAYQEAIEREDLAGATVASASENLHLVQQKYNVGSATILDLIDSQVQLQRAQSDLVSALAAIRVAEAALDRVRGQGE